jgi:glycosyltransferase involved in cell wall biosynthesis
MYNREQFIAQAIIIVLEQDMPTLNVETLLVDDDSTDRTNAGEDRILSLIGINELELQMRNVLSHG